ncbi:MAG: PD-(D/E)XK nuclease family protein [Veillonellaceae bacterium]|nr:PD-(D/E)XK nuclease family protein [Veillonellaceae bacterium]
MVTAIELVRGAAGSGKTRHCFAAIAAALRENPARPCVLIVPDQASYTTERELARYCGGGFANVVVLGFARLGYRLFQEQGETQACGLSKLGKEIVLRHVLQREREQLTIFQRAQRQPHFSTVLAGELQALSQYRVTPEDLRRAAAQTDSVLAAKLRDTATVKEAYEAYLALHFPANEERTDALLAAIDASPWLASAAVWVDGFPGFAPRDREIITAVLRRAARGTITLTLPAAPQTAANETSVYHRQWQAYEAMRAAFSGLREIALTEEPRFASESGLAGWAGAAFRRTQNSTAPAGIRVTEAHSPAEEVTAVLREICRLVREEGYRYRDIAVLLRTHSAYTDRLVRACEQYEVPYFTDSRQAMRHDALAVLLDCAVQITARGWQTDLVLRLLKTGLLPLARAAVEETEMYCRRYGIRPADWTRKERWEHRERRNLTDNEEPTEAEQALWERVDGVRRFLLDWLKPLTEAFRAKQTVRTRATAMYRCLAALPPEATAAAPLPAEDADLYRARIQVYRRLLTLLDEWVYVAGEEVWSVEEFLQVWRDMWQELCYSLIPPTLDHVTITTIDRGFHNEARAVFILGQNEGVFPLHAQAEGLWTDRERTELLRLAVDLGPNSMQRNFRERQWLYLAWTRARERLYISYALGGETGEALEPAFALRRLWERKALSLPQPAAAATVGDDWVRPRQSLLQLPAALAEETADPLWYALYDWALTTPYREAALRWTRGLFYRNDTVTLAPEVGHALYAPDNRFRGSVSAFETYRQCPFRFFARYGLQLEESQEHGLNLADFGVYLHAGLQRFGEELLASGRQWRDADTAEIAERSREISDEIAPRLHNDIFGTNAYFGFIRYQLDRTFAKTVQRLAEWSARGEFRTEELESRFRLAAGEVDGVDFDLRGTLDRLDVYRDPETGRDYYLVVDYKTGNVKLSLADIYYGLRLQLATYLYAVLSRGNAARPAGIMYIYIRDERQDLPAPPESTEELRKLIHKQLRAGGYFLAEREVLTKIDSEFATEWSFLPIELKKDGTFRKDAPVETADVMRDIVRYVALLLPQFGAEILRGRVSVTPVRQKGESPCRYCGYRSLCGFDPQLPGNVYEEIPPLPEEDALARIRAAVKGGADNGLDGRTTGGD